VTKEKVDLQRGADPMLVRGAREGKQSFLLLFLFIVTLKGKIQASFYRKGEKGVFYKGNPRLLIKSVISYRKVKRETLKGFRVSISSPQAGWWMLNIPTLVQKLIFTSPYMPRLSRNRSI